MSTDETHQQLNNEEANTPHTPLQSMRHGMSRTRSRCSRLKPYIPLTGILVTCLLTLVLASLGLGISNNYYNFQADSTPVESNKLTGGSPTYGTEYCIHHTPTEYLDKLKDNIDDLCVPKSKDSDTNDLIKTKHFVECPDQNIYIKEFCLCDATIQCNSTAYDNYQKTNCTKCRDSTHCPCQNSGKCSECPQYGTGKDITCICKRGTVGRYCTKISSRRCRGLTENDDKENLTDCNTTNKAMCKALDYSPRVLLCDWTSIESQLQYLECTQNEYPNGGEKIQSFKENRGPENEGQPMQTLLGGIIALMAISSILLSIYIWKMRHRNLNRDEGHNMSS